ncbi:histidinol-phosphate transaminase [Neisseria sp. Ec49-e6-T10]|uniref:histidinol-phosphate transaminase n=1 Tax=Neisseria sp. Ec49-e6-T10 TaxID=3140744 RepID=UPI003EBA352C
MDITNIIRPEIKAMKAYPVPSSEGYIKLDAMENPYTYSDELIAELSKALAQAPLNRYPDPNGHGLKDDLREAFDIPQNAHIILGNGSDELITIIMQAIAKPDAVVLSVEPSFVMYKINALFSKVRYVGVPLNEDFSLNLENTLAAIKKEQPSVVFIAYPNNPTGPRFEREDVLKIIEAAPGLVVVDEAYQAFASDSFMDLAGSLPNLVVLRTLSKVGFAGIRVGYGAGCPEIISELDKVRPPYNMNQLSITVAKFALHYKQSFEEQAKKIMDERERMRTALKAYDQITLFASEANFLTVRVPNAPALFEALKNNMILVKLLHGVHPLLDHCLRFTVGKPEENQAVLDVISQFFES